MKKMENFIEIITSVNFARKKRIVDEVIDHCHLPSKNKGTTQNECNVKVTQKQKKLFPFVFHKFSIHGCHLF